MDFKLPYVCPIGLRAVGFTPDAYSVNNDFPSPISKTLTIKPNPQVNRKSNHIKIMMQEIDISKSPTSTAVHSFSSLSSKTLSKISFYGENDNDNDMWFHGIESTAVSSFLVNCLPTSKTLGVSLVNLGSSAISSVDFSTAATFHQYRYQFVPGFACVGELLSTQEGETNINNMQKGDIIVGVNGCGFRRFAWDSSSLSSDEFIKRISNVTIPKEVLEGSNHAVVSKNEEEKYHEVDVPPYTQLLHKIRAVQTTRLECDPPLQLVVERHGWDTPCWAFHRFLQRHCNRDNESTAVMEALKDFQVHSQEWRPSFFPIDLLHPPLQRIFKSGAFLELYDKDGSGDGSSNDKDVIPCLHVDVAKLQSLLMNVDDCDTLDERKKEDEVTVKDLHQAVVIFLERALSSKTSQDPRQAKVNVLLDISGCPSILGWTASSSVSALKQLYRGILEPNYPECLNKLVIYPMNTSTPTTTKTASSYAGQLWHTALRSVVHSIVTDPNTREKIVFAGDNNHEEWADVVFENGVIHGGMNIGSIGHLSAALAHTFGDNVESLSYQSLLVPEPKIGELPFK